MEPKLRAESFEDMIMRRGMPVLWYRSQKCPCWNDNSGQPDYSCKACGGYGYLYEDPIEARHIVVHSLILSKDFTPIGEYRMGDCVASIPYRKKMMVGGKWQFPFNEIYDIGEWDKIIILNSEFRSHETLIKNQTIFGREADTLRNEEVTKIINILTINKDTGAVTYYVEDEDFSLEDSKITWLDGGNAPEDEEKYSVLYYHRPVYLGYTQLPQSRDQDNQRLPKKLILRYRDVI